MTGRAEPVTVPDINLTVNQNLIASAGSGVPAEGGGGGWTPEQNFSWQVIENPEGSSVLTIKMYAFQYHPDMNEAQFFSSYSFAVTHTVTPVAVTALTTDKEEYMQDEPVTVCVRMNNQGVPTDVVAGVKIKTGGSDLLVDSLLLDTLPEFSGDASFCPVWNSTGYDPGYYRAEVTLQTGEGELLGLQSKTFRIGSSSGEIFNLIASPDHFVPGDPVDISVSFLNSGTIPLNGSVFIKIQNTAGVVVRQFTHPFTDLIPGRQLNMANVWDTTNVADDVYHIVSYAAFDSMTTNVENTMVKQTAVILTRTSPNYTVTSGSDIQIYGTSGANQINLESGAKAELINFPGENNIQIQSSSNLFAVSRSGTIVTFEGSDGTILKIPATISVQTVDFSDKMPMTLKIHGNEVMLDDQAVTTTPTSIESDQGEPVACGAYVAPGVWKEFDCYNLAAIGKTTNDDPFTPSWRLIGGYWQWGRKGPDPSQWYDTNTPNFAHGPTGPSSSEANSGSISVWGSSNAPDGAWSDSYKTTNDPCPVGRVPTETQWDGVLNNNTQSTVGTWDSDDTNYSSARFFGDKLMLPAAGGRGDGYFGELYGRGSTGGYWSSSEDSDFGTAWGLFFGGGSGSYDGYYYRLLGYSVRCIAE
jgi:hypothetical protein